MVGASTIVGLLVGGIVSLDRHDVVLPQAPTGLTATATTCAPPRCDRTVSAVALRWTAPTDGSITGFRVRRDGSPIPDGNDLPAATTEFVDHGVTAGARHEYAVIATSPEGDSPSSDGLDVQVPLPPLRAAQLRGLYEVTLVVRDAVQPHVALGYPDPEARRAPDDHMGVPAALRRGPGRVPDGMDRDDRGCCGPWRRVVRPGLRTRGSLPRREAASLAHRGAADPPHDAAMLGGAWSVVASAVRTP